MKAKTTNGAAAPGIGHNSDKIPQFIRDSFEDIFRVNGEIAEATEKYCAPLRKKRVKFWRTLKAESGINRKTLDAMYAFFVIAKEALELEDEDHRDKVLADLSDIHAALHPGQTVNWVEAIERTVGGKKKKAPRKKAAKKKAAPPASPDAPAA